MFTMGVLSAVIVGPCVAAPLAGALLYINQTRDAVLGGTALFSMALGMGVPLLAVGVSAGTLMPRAGAWMQTVKNFFGVVLLGLAIWIVSPVIPSAVPDAPVGRAVDLLGDLSACTRSAAAQRLRLSQAVEGRRRDSAADRGGLAGRRSFRRARHAPAAGGAAQRERGATEAVGLAASSSASAPSQTWSRSWRRPGAAPVMLDFYADWCVSCKEMERFTFTDPKVRARMGRMLLLKADVTANHRRGRGALLQRFGLFGPPGTIFFDAGGKELEPVASSASSPPTSSSALWTLRCAGLMSRAGQVAIFVAVAAAALAAGLLFHEWRGEPRRNRASRAAATGLMLARLPDLAGQSRTSGPVEGQGAGRELLGHLVCARAGRRFRRSSKSRTARAQRVCRLSASPSIRLTG